MRELTRDEQRRYSRMKLEAMRTGVYYDQYAPSNDYQYAGICDDVVVCYAKTIADAARCAAERMDDNNEITRLMAA